MHAVVSSMVNHTNRALGATNREVTLVSCDALHPEQLMHHVTRLTNHIEIENRNLGESLGQRICPNAAVVQYAAFQHAYHNHTQFRSSNLG